MFNAWKIKSLNKKANIMYAKRHKDSVSDLEIQKEIKLHMQLVEIYKKCMYNKKFPNAAFLMQESYRVAASINDPESQYQLAKLLYDRANFWKDLDTACFKADIHTKYMNDLYQEAQSFMLAAEEHGHALAMRLHGLSVIHGWGVEPNEEDGFKRIVSSIEKEGTWDKASQIFEELDLNKPEFFTSLMNAKNNK